VYLGLGTGLGCTHKKTGKNSEGENQGGPLTPRSFSRRTQVDREPTLGKGRKDSSERRREGERQDPKKISEPIPGVNPSSEKPGGGQGRVREDGMKQGSLGTVYLPAMP